MLCTRHHLNFGGVAPKVCGFKTPVSLAGKMLGQNKPPRLQLLSACLGKCVEPRNMKHESKESLDIIWGAKAIAKALNLTDRQAFYLLESGELPVRKVGGKWCASRSKLQEFFGMDDPPKREAAA